MIDAIQSAEIERLRAAIAKHRDARGDDRCWTDDPELYRALDYDTAKVDTALPPKCAFLTSCERFWHQRQRPADRLAASLELREMTIAQLQAEILRLRTVVDALEER